MKQIIKLIQYLFHFKTYSLDEYLDIISQFTDNMIIREKNHGFIFTGGDCTVSSKDGKKVYFYLRMYFINSSNERILKESSKIEKISIFNNEAQSYITEEIHTFEIKNPIKEV